MTRIARTLFFALFALFAALPAAHAQRNYSQAEIDQMLAPVALYPDGLLSQVLMAATYPEEVAEAARWTRANPGLPADDAVRAVEGMDWDASVKSLVAFPEILERMAGDMGWTRRLGEAFIAQEADVMDSVQELRRRADAEGNLQSDDRLRVEQDGGSIALLPAAPGSLYVPYYDPRVVYGTWWWPTYQPVAWAPWPGYARHYRPGRSAGFWWGRPVGLSANFFFGSFDWRARRVRVASFDNHYYRAPARTGGFVGERSAWRHEPRDRRDGSQRQGDPRQRAGIAPEGRGERRVDFEGSRFNRREGRDGPAQAQAQPQERVRASPEARGERRVDLEHPRFNRREGRDSPASAQVRDAPPQAQQQQRVAIPPETRRERRNDSEHPRFQRRESRDVQARVPQFVPQVAPQRAAPVQIQAAPFQPRPEHRERAQSERRVHREAAPQPAVRMQAPPQARPQMQAPVQARPQAQAPAQARPHVQPPARQERREARQEQRHERGQRGAGG